MNTIKAENIVRIDDGFNLDVDGEQWQIKLFRSVELGNWWRFDPLSFDPGVKEGEYSNPYATFEDAFDGLIQWLDCSTDWTEHEQ